MALNKTQTLSDLHNDHHNKDLVILIKSALVITFLARTGTESFLKFNFINNSKVSTYNDVTFRTNVCVISEGIQQFGNLLYTTKLRHNVS